MLEITDEEIKMLIDDYKKNSGRETPRSSSNNKAESNNKTNKVPVYDLRTLLEAGIKFIYGDMHFKNGKVEPCTQPFLLSEKHSCQKVVKTLPLPVPHPSSPCVRRITSRFMEVISISPLPRSTAVSKVSWAGYNLALLTGEFSLNAYFKKELLFNKIIADSCALCATSDKIYIGTNSGEIVNFDPVKLARTIKKCHNAPVTTIACYNGISLSSSRDGTIFYNKKIHISASPILDVKFINEDFFICSCEDNSIVVYRKGITRVFKLHSSRIHSLTLINSSVHNKSFSVISSSDDGNFGIIHGINSDINSDLNIESDLFSRVFNVKCSMHKQISSERILGFGMGEIKVFDLSSMEVIFNFAADASSVAIRGNIIAYANKSTVVFRDLHTSGIVEIEMYRKISDISFSVDGNMLLVTTVNSSYILDLKHI